MKSQSRSGLMTVGIADMAVSRNGETLATYALGSCLGIAVYDPVAHAGGLLHVMLPLSTIDRAKAESRPLMFVDTGIPMLFRECYRHGAKKERMILKVAGGASLTQGDRPDTFEIGKRNILMLRKLLWKNGLVIAGQDVGGNTSRDLFLDTSTGEFTVRVGREARPL